MQSREDCVAHLTELLWRCTCLPEICDARVNDGVLQNGDFARHHIQLLQAEGDSSLGDGCAEQGGPRMDESPQLDQADG